MILNNEVEGMSDDFKDNIGERLILDFNTSSPITSYNYTSFIGGVMFAHNMNMYPYYLSNHILLLSNKHFDVSCDDMIMFEDKNVFQIKKIKRDILAAKEIKEDIIEKLNNGYYASVTVDEFYIPNRYFYKKMSFYHDMLIYGYDLSENVFFTAAYDLSGYFNTMKCSIDIVAASISKCLNERKTKPHFHYYKCKNNSMSFDIAGVKSKLEKYISSEPIAKKKYNGRYGLSAYDGLIRNYRYACENNTYWRKASFNMLYEHKKIMLDRVNYINSNHYEIDSCLIDKFAYILKASKIIQATSLKYEITRKESVMMNIIAKIEEMAEIEKKSIEELLRVI